MQIFSEAVYVYCWCISSLTILVFIAQNNLYLKTQTGDSFSPFNGNPFSTIDRDNDINPDKSCAEFRGKGGNWYYGKQTTKEFQCLIGGNNLNGVYGQLDLDVKRTEDELKTRQIASMNWYYLTGKYVPLKSAAYMVRDCWWMLMNIEFGNGNF